VLIKLIQLFVICVTETASLNIMRLIVIVNKNKSTSFSATCFDPQ